MYVFVFRRVFRFDVFNIVLSDFERKFIFIFFSKFFLILFSSLYAQRVLYARARFIYKRAYRWRLRNR